MFVPKLWRIVRGDFEPLGSSASGFVSQVTRGGSARRMGSSIVLTDARRMERRERRVLAALGFPDPYSPSEGEEHDPYR